MTSLLLSEYDVHPNDLKSQEAETVENPTGQDSRLPTLIFANIALIVTVIFGAGVTYSRVGTVEARVAALEARESQLDALAAIQSKIETLQKETERIRDRLDRRAELPKP
jgi:anti-sigma-K factor RskA